MPAKFHLPDFVRHFKLNMILLEMLNRQPEIFYDGVEIASVYGTFPGSVWNGGRSFSGKIDAKSVQGILEKFNSRNIPLRFTFTNPHVGPEHLRDPFCNTCMKMADNGMNEVIVVSPLLEDYIRNRYPNFKITSSTCKQIEDMDKLCEELEKDYNLVVLDYNWNNKFEILEKIPHKEKCELLVNACCTPNCKRRKEHYDFVGEYQIKITEHMKHPDEPFNFRDFECPQMGMALYQTIDYPTHISPKDIYNRYVPMGYENFKIEGRSVPDINILEAYVYYMIKPEYRDEARLFMLLALTRGHKYFNN
ncbi:MAG: hypothetical protein PUB89_09465 [Oscillospiraceae bacterium]|nr:hypothetical protein [Oscillospiraceae bacterium]MDD6083048.1 hypothetical protein [Oscillospiraceae bacterium]